MEIMKGAESFSHEGRLNAGVVVLQGFTGTTGSVIYLARFLADNGLHIECPRLSGHGTKWEDLNKVSYTDWIKDVENAYSTLRKRVDNIFVEGLSMGGALALYLEESHSEILGGILINHIILLEGFSVRLLPILKLFIKSVPAISSDIKDPSEHELAYDRTPTGGAHEMVKLLKLVRDNLNKVEQPNLIFKSREDHVVPLSNVEYTLKYLPSKEKEIIWLENSYHVATMDYDKDIICEKSLGFIKKHLSVSKG